MTVKRCGDGHESSTVSHSISHKMDGFTMLRKIFLLVLVSTLIETSQSKQLYKLQISRKCCSVGYIFNEKIICVNRTAKIMNDYEEIVIKDGLSCQSNDLLDRNNTQQIDRLTYTILNVPDNFCIMDSNNGTKVLTRCADRRHSSFIDLGTITFFGAQTYMFINFAHVVLCIVVVVIHLAVPTLGHSLYNRAVLRHNICLLMHGVILQLLGFCELTKSCQFNDKLMIFWWLCLQYFTIATVFWLNVICYDMTLAITRFRWIGGNGTRSDSTETRRLFMYGLFAWGGPLIPTVIAGLCDYIPGVQSDFILKPNFLDFRKGPSLTINLYFFLVPAFTLLLNNILFVFTTYRIITIQRSTKIATRNQTNLLKQKYFIFLRLYLLMGAPWFFGMIFGICWNKLVILKMCRLVQPTLWLLMLITYKEIVMKIKRLFIKYKRPKCSIATISA